MGLHRPSHSQDFSKFRVELREGELKDRVRTWAVCNIVAQRVATGYGQPSSSLYDWTLASSASLSDPNFALPESIRNPLLIEQLSDKITKSLYSNRRDPVGLTSDTERPNFVNLLVRDLEDLEDALRPCDCLTIWAIRKISIAKNDLPERLAEVLAQLWKSSHAARSSARNAENGARGDDEFDARDLSLQLKVRCRMSMSVVYDSVWRWREDFQARDGRRLEAYLNNPTDPGTVTDSGASSASGVPPPGQPNGIPSNNQTPDTLAITGMPGLPLTNPMLDYGTDFYDVFDPVRWTLDGDLPLPYDTMTMQGMEFMTSPGGMPPMQNMAHLAGGGAGA
ncbi:MAG: hypothetical protein Q9227_000038 [Pyrenula ochraceoflavens]